MSSKIQLYTLGTPNGQKVSIALEEMSIPYDVHVIDIMKGDQFKPEFIKVNPNSKIPAIVDPDANQGKGFSVFESGAILVYLAKKSGLFLSKDPLEESEALQWLFFQMGGVGPMFGQFGHFFKYGKSKCDHPYPVQRYTDESKRLLGVLDRRLEQNEFLSGKNLSIADFATMPWILCLDKAYGAQEALELKKFTHVDRWVKQLVARPGVQRGLQVASLQ